MPKSRKRRPSTRRPSSGRRELPSWTRNLFLADEAERRGDAAVLSPSWEAAGKDDHGQLIWRPWRLQYLAQFADLGRVLPRWAHSRWILAQACHWLDADNRRGRCCDAEGDRRPRWSAMVAWARRRRQAGPRDGP